MKRLFMIVLCLVLCLNFTTSLAVTRGEQNALQSALSYLNYTSFSYQGLIGQLEYEGYSSDECKYAVDNCGADWYDMAVQSAESYLQYTSFSKKGLIDQLLYEGFTQSEAEYGAAVAYGENPAKPNTKKQSGSNNTQPQQTAAPEPTVEQQPSTKEAAIAVELPKNGSSFDLSGLSFDELCSLQSQVNLALWNSDGWQEVLVPAGLYQVGVEIPAGKWNVSMNNNWARIKIGSTVSENGNEVESGTRDYYSVQINKDVSSQTITFNEGMYVEIYNDGLIFSPTTGASFSFR